MSLICAAQLCWRMLRLDEEAIREVARNRWALAYGVGAAVLAGLARHYDRPDPLRWLWLGPALSVGVGIGLASMFYLAGRLGKGTVAGYAGFLSVFLFTSPLGWLYAFPGELLLGERTAHTANFVLFAVVTCWRVAVLLEAYKLLLGLTVWRRVLAFLVPVGVLVGLVSGFAGTFQVVMASMMGSDEVRDAQRQAALLWGLFWTLTVLLPGATIYRLVKWRGQHRVPVFAVGPTATVPTLALVALNDLRICDQELLEVGLTLPGLTERGQVLTRLPNLALLTLAGMVPPEWRVNYVEASAEALLRDPPQADLVAVAAYTASIEEAYELADCCRERGATVVLGGLHVTSCPEEASAHADALVIGEAESVWPQLLSDFECLALRPAYRDPYPGKCDLSRGPLPRLDLLADPRRSRLLLQTQRGCVWDCEFCAASKLYGRGFRQKPLTCVRRELDALVEVAPQPYLELADDNTFCDPRYGKDLCRLLGEFGARWFAEADVSIADDPELLRLMAANGCREVLIGFESLREPSLDGLDSANWKKQRRAGYREAIERIQSAGVAVNGCFILGLDGDDPSVFEELVEFVADSGLADVQVTLLTPFPNTRLYRRLNREGRLLRDRFWDQCTLLDVTFRPKLMTPEQLREGFHWTVKQLFERGPYRARRRRFVTQAANHSATPALQ